MERNSHYWSHPTLRQSAQLERLSSSESYQSDQLRPVSQYMLPEIEYRRTSDDRWTDSNLGRFNQPSCLSSLQSPKHIGLLNDRQEDLRTHDKGEQYHAPVSATTHEPALHQHKIPRKPCPTRLPSCVPNDTKHDSLETVQANTSSESIESINDPHLVSWSGPDDASNPLNWHKRKKWIATLLVSSFTFISPAASTMVAPALPTIAIEYGITSSIERVMVMSIFLLAYAVGPFLFGPLSEIFGRVVVLQSANMFYLIFNTACGFAKTKEQMLAFRFLSGLGGSAPQAIGGGVLSDCWRAEERGSALAIYSLAPFISPAIAPVAGGYITQYTTWRWVFWSTSLVDLGIQILAFLFLDETYTPAILAKKAKKLRKSTGNEKLHTKWQSPDQSLAKIMQKSMFRPFIMLFTQPSLQAMALYRAYLYGIMYLVLSTFPMVFEDSYNQDVGRASLNYLSLGIGFVVGLQISGPMQDKIYKYCKFHAIDPSVPLFGRLYHKIVPSRTPTKPEIEPSTKPSDRFELSNLEAQKTTKDLSNDDPSLGIPEHRLPLALPFGLLVPVGLVLYGWAAERGWHWIVPNIGAVIMCIGLIVTFNCAQAYVVDSYTNHAAGINYAASATGAAAFVRTMAGFSFPLFAPKMYSTLGVGWGNTLLGGVSLVLGILAPLLLWRWGRWLRARSICS